MLNTQMDFLLRSVTLAVALKITIICQIRKCQQSGNTPCALGLFMLFDIKYMHIYQKKIRFKHTVLDLLVS